MNTPKIYVYSAAPNGGDGPAFALAEDGTGLGSHWCSNERWALHDLGVNEGSRPDRHETYRRHYPNGYEMVFVPAAELASHEGVQNALKLNHANAPAEEEGEVTAT